MFVDDFNGELVDTETVSDAKLSEMDADYAKYMPDSSTWDRNSLWRDHLQAGWDEIKAEIAARKTAEGD